MKARHNLSINARLLAEAKLDNQQVLTFGARLPITIQRSRTAFSTAYDRKSENPGEKWFGRSLLEFEALRSKNSTGRKAGGQNSVIELGANGQCKSQSLPQNG